MDQNLQQQIKARIEELPEDVQKAIMDADLDTRIQTIGNKHHLHIDQIGKLEDETLLVMLAFTDPSSFANQLESGLGVPKAEAESLASDVSNEVFVPIRESMKEYLEQRALLNTLAGETSSAPSTKSAPTPAPTASVFSTPAPKPQVPLAPHPHDLMLVEKTVTAPPTPPKNPPSAAVPATPPPPKPQGYKADPYREPPEP